MGDDPDLRSRFTQEYDGWGSDRFLEATFRPRNWPSKRLNDAFLLV
jgi:hypothetical protein